MGRGSEECRGAAVQHNGRGLSDNLCVNPPLPNRKGEVKM